MPYKVLIAEDDPMVAMVNEQFVCRSTDFLVCASCRNGQNALEYLENHTVDLVILDVYMPFMDGIETLKEIRARRINTEVIMVTAANESSVIESTMHFGVLDYLIKPFTYERFRIALEKFVSQSNMLGSASVLDQERVDSLTIGRKTDVAKNLPKGIHEKTLNRIIDYVHDKTEWIRCDQIAKDLDLSNVTVRHYITYLTENGRIQESIDYETGGRPRILYKKK